MEKIKRFFIIFTLVLLLPLSLLLTSCNNDNEKEVKLPTTAYEKVKFAFSGVESSFSGASSNSNNKTAHAYSQVIPYSSSAETALNAIFAEYRNDDEPKNNLDGLSYSEPPMTQFQCLKYAFEKIGDNYQFGTKYYYTITGTVYLDMETGFSMKDNPSEEYKYDFAFTLAMDIFLDENDLINADVSFNISLTKGTEERNTLWYVNMELDYDMNKTSPNYRLLMLTDNQEGELEYLNRVQGYEYDYVEVTNNQIKEWRKFTFDASEQLVVDETHQTFDDYANKENFEYKAGNCKWYKDGTLHKFTRLNKPDGAERKLKIARELYAGLGLNSTDINASEFLSKQGVQNDVINSLYTDFSNAVKEELIYNLICKKEDDSEPKVANIAVKNSNGEEWFDSSIEYDGTLRQILSWEMWGESTPYPKIFYVDKNGNNIESVQPQDLDNFTYKIKVGNTEVEMGLNEALSNKIVYELGGYSALEENTFKITITVTEKEHSEYTASFSAYIGNTSVITKMESFIFPKELLDIGVLQYEAQNASFELRSDKTGYTLTIFNTYNDELTAYKNKLVSNGFVKDENGKYIKLIDNNVLKLSMEFNGGYDLTILITIETNNGFISYFPLEKVKGWLEGKFDNFIVPTNINLLCKVGSDDTKYLYVFGLTDAEYSNYISSIGELDNVAFAGKYDVYMTSGIIKFIYDDYYYTIEYYIENGYLYFEFDLARNGSQEVYKLIVNNTDAYIFNVNSFNTYLLNITLNEGDTFVVEPSDTGHYLTSYMDYFSYVENNKKVVYTVLQSGIYTFSYNGALMEVTKG